MTSRRTFLEGALAAAAGAAMPPLARPAFAAEAARIVPVTDELAMVTGAGGNVLVRATDTGQVLVDSGAAEFSGALLAALGKLPGAGRVRTLFNTHWHLDQVGSNEAIGRAGAPIVAHAKTRAHLATDYYVPDDERYEKALPKAAQPSETFYTEGEKTIDGERIEYGYLIQAHTDGDAYVFFRDANVCAVGGAISPAQDPELDWFGGGWLGGRVDSLATLLEASDADTRFVPSFGPAVGRSAVQAEHDLMLELFERMVDLIRKGDGPEDMLAAGVMRDLPRTFDDPAKFVYAAEKGLWAHHNTLTPDIV
jgi:cyclase